MVGSPESVSSLGVIPSAISWLYRSIADQKQRTGARFSVRVSAIEVAGPAYNLKDLLQQHAAATVKIVGNSITIDCLPNLNTDRHFA
uniref:Kinesin motor domain-containing protein n=1 Tax=Rhodnius prolixus TaxID=13249 RepID=T1HCL3_RHOPR